jgi:hypothetical protein
MIILNSMMILKVNSMKTIIFSYSITRNYIHHSISFPLLCGVVLTIFFIFWLKITLHKIGGDIRKMMSLQKKGGLVTCQF